MLDQDEGSKRSTDSGVVDFLVVSSDPRMALD
jgi:hypothetical protein